VAKNVKRRIVEGVSDFAVKYGEPIVDAISDFAVKEGEPILRDIGEALGFAVPRPPRPRQKPQVRLQRPDPHDADPAKWLQRARAEAAERYSAHNRLPGKLTASVKGRVELDPQKLKNIPGAMGERRVPGDEKYDRLMASVQEKGFDPNTHIWLGVNHLGEPYVAEGNTRLAVARDLGIDRIPAEVMWYGGGEDVGGLMEPRLLEHYMPQSELMRDPNFSRWFEGSRGVDEYGEPQRFFHGTQTHEGSDFGNISAFDRLATTRLLKYKPNMNSVGSWFSERADNEGAGLYTPDKTGVMYPVYLNYKNPWNATFDEFLDRGNELDWDYDAARPRGLFDPEPLREWLKNRGHDAIQFPRGQVEGDQNVTVVLEPTQIKSATGNRGTYDPNDPDINKARGGLAVKKRKR
jgi:hypothetical protein